jgi:hypothetical protein
MMIPPLRDMMLLFPAGFVLPDKSPSSLLPEASMDDEPVYTTADALFVSGDDHE